MTNDALYLIDLRVEPAHKYDPQAGHWNTAEYEHATLELTAVPDHEAWEHATHTQRLSYARWAAGAISRASLQLAYEMLQAQVADKHERAWHMDRCSVCGVYAASDMTRVRDEYVEDCSDPALDVRPVLYVRVKVPSTDVKVWRARARDLLEQVIADDLAPAPPDRQPDHPRTPAPTASTRKEATP